MNKIPRQPKNYHVDKWDDRARQDRKNQLKRKEWARLNRQGLEILRTPQPEPLKHLTSPSPFVTVGRHSGKSAMTMSVVMLYNELLVTPAIAAHPSIKGAFRVGLLNERRDEMVEWLEERNLTTSVVAHRQDGVDIIFNDTSVAMLFKMTFF